MNSYSDVNSDCVQKKTKEVLGLAFKFKFNQKSVQVLASWKLNETQFLKQKTALSTATGLHLDK